MTAVNYVLMPFEGNINPGDPTGLKFYIQENKHIDKQTYKLDIPVSNSKDIVEHFISWKRISIMLVTFTVAKNIFRSV